MLNFYLALGLGKKYQLVILGGMITRVTDWYTYRDPQTSHSDEEELLNCDSRELGLMFLKVSFRT